MVLLKFDQLPPDIVATDSKRIDLNLLLTLDALLSERNVTRAAARLSLSQPTVSAQLNRLRDLFSDPLLVPAQRGMIPTPRALELQDSLHDALEGVRAVAAERVRFDPTSEDLVVSIAASDYVQYSVLMPLALALKHEAPGIRLTWRMLDGRLLAGQAERGEVDLAIMTSETAAGQLRSRKLYENRYVCIARCGHPKVSRSINLDTLSALDHVVVSPRGGGFTGPTDAALAALGRSRRVALSVASFLVVPEIVSRSDMIALVPERLVRGIARCVIVMDPPIPIKGFTIGMVWHDRRTAQPAHRWLRDRIGSLARSAHGKASESGSGIVNPEPGDKGLHARRRHRIGNAFRSGSGRQIVP